MTQRSSITLGAAALIIVAIFLLWPRQQPADPQISWGQGFQWGEGKFGDRR